MSIFTGLVDVSERRRHSPCSASLIVAGLLCKKDWRFCLCKRRRAKEILPLWHLIWALLGWGMRSYGWSLHQGLLWSSASWYEMYNEH